MIQNITREYEKENKEAEINYKEIVKKLFTVPNIIIYIMTILISTVSFGSSTDILIAPFGIALVAAAISAGMPIAMVYISSIIGTAIKFSGKGILFYLITSAVFIAIYLIKKPERNENETEQVKLGKYLLISIIAVSAVKMIFSKIYVYDVLVALILAISAYIFYKIFVNSINVIREYGKKRAFSIEEVVGASLLLTIAISALGNASIFSFSIRNILCILIVLVLGYQNGILVGGVSGITVGIVLGIIGSGNPTLIATYAISGMLAGLLNRFGKVGVIIGFILGNILITYSTNGGVENIIVFQEILIAAVGLLAFPKKIKIDIEDIMPKTKMLTEGTPRIEEGTDTLVKLKSISKTVDDLAKNYSNSTTNAYNKNLQKFQAEVDQNLQKLKNNILYEYIEQDQGELIADILDNTIENNILTENGLISVLAKHNIYVMNSDDNFSKIKERQEIREVLKVMNNSYTKCKKDAIWQKKIDEKSNNMSTELKFVKNAIDDVTNNISNSSREENKYEEKEKAIKANLEKVGVKDIHIKQQETGRYAITVYTNICEEETGKNCPIKQIKREIEKQLNEKIKVQNQECGIRQNKEMCKYTYISEDKFLLQTGIARTKKDTSIISGDVTSQVALEDGQYMLAISDGMGSGPEARKNSKIAISMLERLLSTGFDKENSIKLINSNLLNTTEEEMYATLDIEILDLYAGKVEFLKNGASPTYIKRGKKVSMIESNSLPAGIINNVKIDTYDKDLKDGDIIVMCSDGIIESNKEYANRKLWLQHLLEEIQTDIPERIANIILKESIDNDFGKPQDDMSVIVVKVLKKVR